MPDLLIVLLIILGVVLYIRGPKVLPRLGEQLGRGVRDTRRALDEAIGGDDKPKDDSAPKG